MGAAALARETLSNMAIETKRLETPLAITR